MVPAYEGGRLPLTTNLADRVRDLLRTPASWGAFPEPVHEWLDMQRGVSRLPGRDDLLVETFPRADRWYLVAYCFEGRNAHQTLGMLLTKRMERAGFAPLGFVATDYVIGIWSVHRPMNVAALFDQPDRARRGAQRTLEVARGGRCATLALEGPSWDRGPTPCHLSARVGDDRVEDRHSSALKVAPEPLPSQRVERDRPELVEDEIADRARGR